MGKNTVKLSFDPDYNFSLIGISSHEKDYRLIHMINNALGFQFVKSNDLEINNIKFSDPQRFTVYECCADHNHSTLRFISNRCENGFLIEEHKNVDFFFQITENHPKINTENLMASLKEVSTILMVFDIDIENLKSKQKFIF